MSRVAAREQFTMRQLKDDLEAKGVTLIGGTVEECSMSYKDINTVMAAQTELITVRGEFNPYIVRMAEKSDDAGHECGE